MEPVSLKHRVEYFALLVVAAVVRHVPRRTALALGRVLGRLAMKVLPERYRLAKENITKALPELSTGEIEENVRKNFEHIGINGVEMLRLDMFKSGSGDIQRYIDIENISFLQDALALKKGVILLTGHLGFWEIGNFVFPELGIAVDAVTKPLKNPLSDAYFTKIRKTFGAGILNSRHGGRRILKSLQAGRAVAILLDQHISPPGSVATEFFGRKAFTTTAITNLAMKYQIPIVPVFCLRQADNRYKIWAEPMLILSGDGANTVEETTQLLTDTIEAAIRRNPSQWFWMHKRWRVKPDKVKDSEK